MFQTLSESLKINVPQMSLDYFNGIPGAEYVKNAGEHYRLLTYLSRIYDGVTFIDAGTYNGFSALALAQNKKNKVITYDIEPKNIPFFKEYSNIEFRQLDINEEADEVIKASPLILLDVDPHDGVQEVIFYAKLQTMGYKGYLLCDDINLNPGMRKFWGSVTDNKKHDLTEFGHHSGTGLIEF